MEVLRCVLGSDHGGIVHVHLRTNTGPTCASRREPNEGASHVRPLAERRAVPHSVSRSRGSLRVRKVFLSLLLEAANILTHAPNPHFSNQSVQQAAYSLHLYYSVEGI